jgi:A/G-specific adenine glycosylase
MDYGTMLKAETENPGRKSAHHTKQSPFKGSDREIRGAIVKLLVTRRDVEITGAEIAAALPMDLGRIASNLDALVQEGFIIRERGGYRIA